MPRRTPSEERKVVAFTGHRPGKIGGYDTPNPTYDQIRKAIRHLLIDLEPTQVISGMALGVDQWAAEIAFELGIPIVAAIPFEGQETRWPADSQIKYNDLLHRAHEIVKVSDPGYSAAKMQRRNEWMVDRCSVLIAVWDGSPGGTANCVKYAQEVGREIRFISPQWKILL